MKIRVHREGDTPGHGRILSPRQYVQSDVYEANPRGGRRLVTPGTPTHLDREGIEWAVIRVRPAGLAAARHHGVTP